MRTLTLSLATFALLAAGTALAAQHSSGTETIDYGRSVTLAGKAAANEQTGSEQGLTAMVVSKACGVNAFVVVGRPPVRKDGSVSFTLGPTVNTVYKLLIRNRELVDTRVLVRPRVEIRRVGDGQYAVTVTTGNGNGLDRRRVTLQRKSPSGRWQTVRTARLKLISPPDDLDAVASATATLQGSGPFRATLTAGQAAPCFAAAVSKPTG